MRKLIVGAAALLVVAAIVGGLVATPWLDAVTCAWIAAGSCALAALVCRSFGELGWTYIILAAALAAIGNGLYALHLHGVAVAWIAGVLAVAIVIVLAAALIRSGAADHD